MLAIGILMLAKGNSTKISKRQFQMSCSKINVMVLISITVIVIRNFSRNFRYAKRYDIK